MMFRAWLPLELDFVPNSPISMPPVTTKMGMHTRKVVSPKRPDLVLSADIPDVEARVLIRDGLDVEADSRDGVDFACGARRELEGVENGFGVIC
jgi:hypothetical protein